MKTLIVVVLLSSEKKLSWSLSMLNLILKRIRSCKASRGPVKTEFSTRLLVLRSGKDPKVFAMSRNGDPSPFPNLLWALGNKPIVV